MLGIAFSNYTGQFTLSAWLDTIELGSMQYMGGPYLDAWGINLAEDALNVLENNGGGTIKIEITGNSSVAILSSTLSGGLLGLVFMRRKKQVL